MHIRLSNINKRIRNKRRNKTYNNDRSIKITRGFSLLLFTRLWRKSSPQPVFVSEPLFMCQH
ncbi:hypothetical protein F8517_09245 [Bacillus thuringiensis]|nr:hypothetical protein F8517_09245 [Bacillus thuringiensis]